MTAFKHNTLMWFLLAITLLMANVYYVYRNFERLGVEKNWVTHTYQVINELEDIVSSVKDVQSAQRGYVITGQVDFLRPYNVARPRLEDGLQRLAALIADNPAQEQKLVLLKDGVDKRVQIAADIIASYEEKGPEAAFAMIRTGAGNREMDEIRALAAGMIATENDLLAVRQEKADNAADLTETVGGAGVAICVLILGAVFLLVHRESLRREKAEKEAQGTLAALQQVTAQDMLISHMTDYLQSCRGMSEAFDVVRKSLPDILPGTYGGIALYNNSRNILETAVSWGAVEAGVGFTPDRCWALRRGQLHHVHPGGSEPLCAHLPALPPGGTLCFPMQAQGEIVGCFFLSAEDEKSLSADAQKAVRRAGEQIALALSNLKLQERLRDQSIRDPLTRLFNRRYLEETAEREIDRARRKELPLGIMMLDIDHFKKYNDTRGHDAGDALLAQFAKLLMEQIRAEDIPCRYGGEEFVIMMPGASIEITLDRAKKICDATRRMKITLGPETFGGVTVSIGVSCYPLYGGRIEELVSAADRALYEAKHNGRDQVRVAATEEPEKIA